MILGRATDNFMFLLKKERSPLTKDAGLKAKRIRMEKLMKMLSSNYIHFWNKLRSSTTKLRVTLRRKRKEWVIRTVFRRMNTIITNIIDKCYLLNNYP